MVRSDGHVSLIDFGLSHKYLDSKGQHIPYGKAPHFKGTYHFCAKNTLEKVRQTRRDDLESLFYTLMRLCNVKMPWVPDHCTEKEHYKMALRARKIAMADFEVMRVNVFSD